MVQNHGAKIICGLKRSKDAMEAKEILKLEQLDVQRKNLSKTFM